MGWSSDCPACGHRVHIKHYSGDICPGCEQRLGVPRRDGTTIQEEVENDNVMIKPNTYRPQRCTVYWGEKYRYPDEWTPELRESIRSRDGLVCSLCSLDQAAHRLLYGQRLHVHHVDGNRYNCEPNNLLTLCSTCHLSIEWSTRD